MFLTVLRKFKHTSRKTRQIKSKKGTFCLNEHYDGESMTSALMQPTRWLPHTMGWVLKFGAINKSRSYVNVTLFV